MNRCTGSQRQRKKTLGKERAKNGMEPKLKPRSGDCEKSTGQGCAEDRSTPRPRCTWQHPLKDERLRAPGLNNKSPIRVRMEARRRAAPAKSLVPNVALSLRPDHLRFGRLRPPSRLCAALRPLTRQGLDCSPRRPGSPTIRAKGKRRWPFPQKPLDAAATWKSILCPSVPPDSTGINRCREALD